MITDIINSPLKTKRFRAIIVIDGLKKHIDFGNKGSKTYIDNVDELTKENYLKRHTMNPLEKDVINNFKKLTPSLLSAHLLWGKHRNIMKNVDELNKRI